jgi:hypothetical protein
MKHIKHNVTKRRFVNVTASGIYNNRQVSAVSTW